MSVKALEREYQQVVDLYKEMVNDLKDIEKEVAEGLVDPDFLDKLKAQIEPIKTNYEWWSWVMYTLHQPERKEKHFKYAQMNKTKINKLAPESHNSYRMEVGKRALSNLKNINK